MFGYDLCCDGRSCSKYSLQYLMIHFWDVDMGFLAATPQRRQWDPLLDVTTREIVSIHMSESLKLPLLKTVFFCTGAQVYARMWQPLFHDLRGIINLQVFSKRCTLSCHLWLAADKHVHENLPNLHLPRLVFSIPFAHNAGPITR